MKTCLRILIAIGLSVSANLAEASDLTESWASVRALGMGNAYTAIVDGSDALFYNPAGLASSGGFSWTLLDPRIGVNGMEAYETFKSISENDDLAALINELYGDVIWIGGGSKSALKFGGFAAAAYANLDISANLNNPAYPVFDLKYAADYGFTTGLGFDLIPAVFKFGLAARRVTRVGTAMPVGVSTLATLDTTELERQLKNRGTAYGLDLGFILTIPSPVKPSLSFTWKNIGNTTFRREAGDAAPAKIESEMILGAALEIDAFLISITPTFDYKYALNENIQMGKKIHAGLEIGLPLIDIRAGMHQGYYTYGVGLNLGLLRFDAASYGVEMGEYPGQLEDRRYIAQVTFELGFDASTFGFGGSGGKGGSSGSGSHGFSGGRKLKQRR